MLQLLASSPHVDKRTMNVSSRVAATVMQQIKKQNAQLQDVVHSHGTHVLPVRTYHMNTPVSSFLLPISAQPGNPSHHQSL